MNLIVHITVMTTIKLVSAMMSMNRPHILLSWASVALKMSDTAASFDATWFFIHSDGISALISSGMLGLNYSVLTHMHFLCTDKDI